MADFVDVFLGGFAKFFLCVLVEVIANIIYYSQILFSITMKRQIKHMIKYKYIPFDLGKKRYGSGSGLSGAASSFMGNVVGGNGSGSGSGLGSSSNLASSSKSK